MKKTQRRRASASTTYSHWHELLASATHPMPMARRTHQLTRMHQGLLALETAAAPAADDWRVVSDAVNLLETLVSMGEMQDTNGLLRDAVAELAVAGARHLQEGKPLRLSGEGIGTVRAVLEDYAEALATLPERTMVRAHRLTERRIGEIMAGGRQAHDVEVMAI